jgi:transcription initiation factor IIF auxiliary subunit
MRIKNLEMKIRSDFLETMCKALTPTLSQREREKRKKPLSLWERGWGEGKSKTYSKQ